MNSTVPFSETGQSVGQALAPLLHAAKENGLAWAAWRLPDTQSVTVILSNAVKPLPKESLVLENLPPGFIFAPFGMGKDNLFLSADFLFTFSGGAIQAPDDHASRLFLKNHEEKVPLQKTTGYIAKNPSPGKCLEKEGFIRLINTGMEEIKKGTFEKFVASRCKNIPIGPSFDGLMAFERLCTQSPSAMVSWVSTPQGGTWLGATPELLVNVTGQTTFQTVALAGTQPLREGVNVKNVSWTQKEIEEQALVERYVISCFKKIRLREYEEHGPRTVISGNLLHLKTDFSVDMKATHFPQLGSVMLSLLHPTSAVCGMPLKPALDFLLEHEGYDRSFYSGYLGPVNIGDNINLFVNLRCMQLMSDRAICYAGAGITGDSEPEKEWEETEMKMNTLLQGFH